MILEKICDKIGINKRFHKQKKDKINSDKNIITSPVQAKLVDFGQIKNNKITFKNSTPINLKEILGDNFKFFSNGIFMNFYLSPKDKHYWKTPYEGKFIFIKKNKGKAKLPIFIGLEKIIKKPFFSQAIKKNATIFSVFKIKNFSLAMIAVGSLFVNAIHAEYTQNKIYKKGERIGYFSIGSSMLLCFPKDKINLLVKLNQRIDIGQAIAKIN